MWFGRDRMKFVRFLLLCFLAVCLLCFTAILLLPRVNEKNIIRLPSKAISEYADFFAAKFSHAYGWVKAACELVHSLLISIVTVCSGIKSRFATPSNPRSQKSKATALVFVTTISNAECNPGKHRSLWTFSGSFIFQTGLLFVFHQGTTTLQERFDWLCLWADIPLWCIWIIFFKCHCRQQLVRSRINCW